MTEPAAHVTFRKQVSDGNYGTEACEVSFDLSAADDAEELLAIARRIVHEELARSPSGNVRRALEAPKPLEPRTWTPDEDEPL